MAKRARFRQVHETTVTDALEFAAKRGRNIAACSVEDYYSDEEMLLLRAVDAYKTKYQRPNPCVSEILAIILSLGYRKITP